MGNSRCSRQRTHNDRRQQFFVGGLNTSWGTVPLPVSPAFMGVGNRKLWVSMDLPQPIVTDAKAGVRLSFQVWADARGPEVFEALNRQFIETGRSDLFGLYPEFFCAPYRRADPSWPRVAILLPIRDKGHPSKPPTMTDNRSMYFARTVLFAVREAGVMLVDMHDASVTEPLEPWLGKVFLLADGTHTVRQLIDLVGRQYGQSPPRTLEATIDSVIERLCESKIVVLSQEPVTLPYYLSISADEQDPERANRLMAEDGFQQPV